VLTPVPVLPHSSAAALEISMVVCDNQQELYCHFGETFRRKAELLTGRRLDEAEGKVEGFLTELRSREEVLLETTRRYMLMVLYSHM
jgi:hypothetical protein